VIQAARVTGRLKPRRHTSHSQKILLATGRIAMRLPAILSTVHPNFGSQTAYDNIGEIAQEYLEEMLRVEGVLDIGTGDGEPLNSDLYAGYMKEDGDDTILLVGGFIGEDPIKLQWFYGGIFGLSVEDITRISERHWLAFFVFRLPTCSEPFPVMAVMATEKDGWGPDAHTLPANLRTKILEAALPGLDAPV
jgi:hypothetical protein